jgi:hypothetical protein
MRQSSQLVWESIDQGLGWGLITSPVLPPFTQPPNNEQIPLLYAPVLPLIRIGLRGRLPQKQIDIIFGASVLTALAHAGYIMGNDSSV